MLPMLIRNGKGTQMILQIAPVNPLGKDCTCRVDSYRLSTAFTEQVCYDLMQYILSKWGLTWCLSLRCYGFIVSNAKRR